MKRVDAGAHLPTPWLFQPAKRSDDRADYCLGPQYNSSTFCEHSLIKFKNKNTSMYFRTKTNGLKLKSNQIIMIIRSIKTHVVSEGGRKGISNE